MGDTAQTMPWLDTDRDCDREALDRVLSNLYHELHAMARRQLIGAHAQALDATALVHEAYLKLIGGNGVRFEDRAHFFSYAASAMRSVVVDDARQRLARKRGGDLQRVADLPEELEGGVGVDVESVALDAALSRLARLDERLAQVVKLRYLVGLSELEIASKLNRSERSIRRDWNKARRILLASLQEAPIHRPTAQALASQ